MSPPPRTLIPSRLTTLTTSATLVTSQRPPSAITVSLHIWGTRSVSPGHPEGQRPCWALPLLRFRERAETVLALRDSQGRVSLALNAARKGLGGLLPTQVVALPSGGLRVAIRGPPAH